jgi:type VI secretion system protein ImpA
MPLDVIALVEPFSGTLPVGADLRQEAGVQSVYFRLKDARAQARTAERAGEAAGEVPVVPVAWQTVRALAVEVLQSRSKDLEVAAWLVEALVRLDGFGGLSEGFALLQKLVERFWPTIHSNDEDDLPGRLSPLAGLNGIGSEGALIQPIRMVPLLPGSPYGTHAHWHLLRLQREPEGQIARDFNNARAGLDPSTIRDRAAEAGQARDAFLALTATLDARCGADAPPSSYIRNALDEVLDAYRTVLGVNGADTGRAPEMLSAADIAPEAPPLASDPSPLPGGPKPISNREEAFAELLRIADFFRRQEPHSPLSYAIEALVTRGRMSFAALLEELLPDQGSRKQLLQTAGIQTDGEGRIR